VKLVLRDRLADLLFNPVEKKFLAVGRDVRRKTCGADQFAISFSAAPKLQCATGIRYRDREKIVVRSIIVEFSLRPCSTRLLSSIGGDLPLPLPRLPKGMA